MCVDSEVFIDYLFGGQFAPMVAHLVEHQQLTPKDIQKLKALIRELEKNNE